MLKSISRNLGGMLVNSVTLGDRESPCRREPPFCCLGAMLISSIMSVIATLGGVAYINRRVA